MYQNACKPAAAPTDARCAPAAFPMTMRTNRTSSFLGNSEPPLSEMMSDDVIRRMMARDGVAVDQLMSLIDRVRGNLSSA